MATGSENVQAAVTRLKDVVIPALVERVRVMQENIDRTASDGLTGPQTEAVWQELDSFATALESVATAPGEIPPVEPVPPMPGPFVPGQENLGPLARAFSTRRPA